MRRRLSFFATLAVAAAVSAAPVPKGAKKTDYFPLGVGTKWEYAEGDDVKTTEVAEMKEEKDARLYTVTYKGEKSPPPTLKRVYRVENDDITSITADGIEAERASVVMKRYIREGDSWSTEHQWKGDELWPNSYKVGAAKKIKTPAGEFTALPVEHNSQKFGVVTRWFADGVGMIRKEQDGKVLSELKSFTPAK